MGEKGKPCRRKAGFKDAVRRASIDSAHLRERCGACDVLELRADRLGPCDASSAWTEAEPAD
jgi:hypothetical protein